MRNVKELRDDLILKYITFSNLTAKTDQDIKVLGTVTACASAIIRSTKVELDYKKFKTDSSEIEFLKTQI